MTRREWLGRAAALMAAGAVTPACRKEASADAQQTGEVGAAGRGDEWEDVRRLFDVDPEYIHLGGLLITSHPRPVRDAIERHRRELDRNPVVYLMQNNTRLRSAVRESAGRYFGVGPEHVAHTGSTTAGLGILYNGIHLEEGDEIITTEHDHYSTHTSLRLKTERTGANIRMVRLYDRPRDVRTEQVVERLLAPVNDRTRVMAITWVHSPNGLKLPVRAVADALAEVNAGRPPGERVLLCVDGLHGFGVENVNLQDLGCDFFVAGCHKWIYGPRGTGVLIGSGYEAWRRVSPTIPPFGFHDLPGGRMSPGGFHAFEHRWALAEAFDFHLDLGKQRVEERIHSLAGQLKEGLSQMRGVELHTPLSDEFSSGIVAFDLEGVPAARVVRQLLDKNIVATQSPYGSRSVRLTPTLMNSPEEMDRTLAAIRSLV